MLNKELLMTQTELPPVHVTLGFYGGRNSGTDYAWISPDGTVKTGGVFDERMDVVSALQAENGMLKAENYSDKNAKEVYAQSLADNRRLRDEAFAYLKPLADESANNRVELAKLQAELKCCCEKQELREQIVLGKVNELALTTQAKFGCLDGTISNIMGTLGKITDTIVPMSAICPTPMAKYNAWVAPTNTPATGA